MKCHVAGDLLPLYLEHLLSEETAAELEAHLTECPACAERFARMQEQGPEPVAVPEDIQPLKAVKSRGRPSSGRETGNFSSLIERIFSLSTRLGTTTERAASCGYFRIAPSIE